jgi:L-ascorbate metabolism protein UlaG (beta-lactamase superfamily)
MWTYRGVKVHWLGHDSFVLQGSRVLVLDPFKASGDYKADILLISHEHFDHLSQDDIMRFSSPSTIIVAPKQCEAPLQQFKQQKKIIEPGQKIDLGGVKIEAVPAYNLNKFREPGKVFHPREDRKVGYVATLDGVSFYHAGDTDAIPEMGSIEAEVALLPVSGTYVMTAEEAAEAAKAIKAKVVVPMHFGKIVGTRDDAERFKKLVGDSRNVEILEPE